MMQDSLLRARILRERAETVRELVGIKECSSAALTDAQKQALDDMLDDVLGVCNCAECGPQDGEATTEKEQAIPAEVMTLLRELQKYGNIKVVMG